MEPRANPVLIVKCPDCGAVIMAGAFNKIVNADRDSELWQEYGEYAEQGYIIEVVSFCEYKFSCCTCKK